jgi:hypothetical protein
MAPPGESAWDFGRCRAVEIMMLATFDRFR